jgi:DNA-binding PadR family transcriptional regulator
MALKHVIIGLLLDHPMHGYALKRALSPAVTSGGLINEGVLYPVLARLERDGLVEKRVVAGEGRPERHVLRTTREGERWFMEWLAGDEGEADEVTYDFFVGQPFLTKYMFFDRLGRAAERKKLEAQLVASRAKLDAFERIREGMRARGVSEHRVAVLDLGIEQQQAKIRWLERLLATRRARKEKSKT